MNNSEKNPEEARHILQLSREIDEILENKAETHNLTAINVKSILTVSYTYRLISFYFSFLVTFRFINNLSYGSFHVKWSNFRKNLRSTNSNLVQNLYIRTSWSETNFPGIFWSNSQYIVKYRTQFWQFLNPLKKFVNTARGLKMYVLVQLFTVFLVTLMKNYIKLNFIWYTVAKMALKIKFQKLCIFLKHHISVIKIGTFLKFPP